MLRGVNQTSGRPAKGRRTKGARVFLGTRVLPETAKRVEAARRRDEALLQAAPRASGFAPLREAVTYNNWFTAAILAARAAKPDLESFIEWGNRTAGRDDLLAARVAKAVADDIDDLRALIPPRNGRAVTAPQWAEAALLWALEQPPGVVADQLVNVPRRDYRSPGQQTLEVFAAQAV